MFTLGFSETNNGVGELELVLGGTLPGGPLDWPVPLPMSGEGNQGIRVCVLMATVHVDYVRLPKRSVLKTCRTRLRNKKHFSRLFS